MFAKYLLALGLTLLGVSALQAKQVVEHPDDMKHHRGLHEHYAQTGKTPKEWPPAGSRMDLHKGPRGH